MRIHFVIVEKYILLKILIYIGDVANFSPHTQKSVDACVEMNYKVDFGEDTDVTQVRRIAYV